MRTRVDSEGLAADALEALEPGVLEALVAYLNLPPVGALADREVPQIGTSEAYELPSELRGPLRARRDAVGGTFADARDLVGISGFGPIALAGVIAELSDLGRHGHRLEPVWGGPAGKRALFDLIDGAERSIHLQTYIIGGEVGLELARRLAAKAEAGIEVRVMFAASGLVISGSPSGTGLVGRFSHLRELVSDLYVRRRIAAVLDRSKVQWIDASPIGRHWRRRSFRAIGVRGPADYERWARSRDIPDDWIAEQVLVDTECAVGFANVDHRKMVLVDGRRAFIGSQNLADAYFYDNELSKDPEVNRRRWQWHDGSTVLEGGIVGDLNRLFCLRWALSGGDLFDWTDAAYAPPPPSVRPGHAVVTAVPSLPGGLRVPLKKNLGRLLLTMLGADRRPIAEGADPIRSRMMQLPQLAERDLYVEHCYPSDAGLLAHWLEHAPGLEDFTMIVPRHYDTVMLGMECDRFYPEMIAAGARLSGYDRAIIHTKVAVADGWYASVGSYNLTLRSSTADLELNFFIQCAQYGAKLRECIRRDLDECVPIEPGGLARYRSRRSLPIVDGLLRYFIM